MTTHPRRAARVTACAVAVTAVTTAALAGSLTAGPALAQDDDPLPSIPSVQPVKPGVPVPSVPGRPTATEAPSPTYSTFTRPPRPSTSAPFTTRPVPSSSPPVPTSVRPTSSRPVPTTTVPSEEPSTDASPSERALAFVLAQVGKPFVEGGTGQRGWGNNELIREAFAAQGVALPEGDAHAWWHYGDWAELAERVPGDLLLYKLRGETYVRTAMFSHDVGYLIEAVPGGTVKEFPLYATVTQGKVLRPTGVYTP